MRKYFFTMALAFQLAFPLDSLAFTKIVDLIFDGNPVEPEKIEETIETIKVNKEKNKKISNPKKLKPDQFVIVPAIQTKPTDIQLEIDTSEVIVKSNKDVQGPISNTAFLKAVTEAVDLWNNVGIANVMFAPLKFASVPADPEDGNNIITFRAIESPEGVPEGAPVISIVTYARSNTVTFMNQIIMVKPGAILDADIIYDPTNDPCLALFTTEGEFVPGGSSTSISEGGTDSSLTAEDLANCDVITSGDITDFAVRTLANVLGLESSAIASAATSPVSLSMIRYSLTSDDEIGLANLYPNKDALSTYGSASGKVLLNKKGVRGAHVVFEDQMTGEPVTSAISDIYGNFRLNYIPAGTYSVYAEPLDGPARKSALSRNFFGFNAEEDFTTGVLEDPVVIEAKKKANLKISVKELSGAAFNINYLTSYLTESNLVEGGGGFILPIKIMPGETISNIRFWGSNINPDFGTLTISGTGVTVSNIREDNNISISPFSGDPPPDKVPGIVVNITCAPGTPTGPRNIIFTGDTLDEANPSFGLRDQITGGLFVTE